MIINNKSINFYLSLGLLAGLSLPIHTQADVSNLPPLVRVNIPPNIFYTLDDSGSMMFEMLPEDFPPIGDGTDGTRTNVFTYCGTSNQCWVTNVFPHQPNVYNINGSGDYSANLTTSVGFDHNITVARWRSAAANKLYYNPGIRYRPWVSASGGTMTPAVPTAALYNPIAPAGGSNTATINLTVNQTATTSWLNTSANGINYMSKTFFPALYYIYNGGDNCNMSTLACFTRYEIKAGTVFPAKASARTDCAGANCTVTEEMQNFANWFQYYRSRILVARGGSGYAFSKQNSTIRVGFGTINTLGTIVKKVTNDFSDANKSSFLTTLYQQRMPALGTPLRKAVDDVGQYFMDGSVTGPWQTQYNVGSASSQLTCRQNYNILMTDGYWNGDGANSSRISNYDGTSAPTINGPGSLTYTYSPVNPYMDNEANTLADIAFYYWSRDLRPDWDRSKKNVPVTTADPAFWPHLTQFTVGLGVHGSLNPATDLAGLTAGTTTWPAAATHQVDDLWHAALNTRGQFFSAGDPTQFAAALESALGTIADRVGDAAAVGTSSSTVRSGSSLFTSTYKTADWSGTLQQKILAANGNIVSNGWTASLPNDWTTRNIFTYINAGQKGRLFTYANLESTDQAYFNTAAASYTGVSGSDIVDYIKGRNDINKFRSRINPFGDFVNSAPLYLKEGDNAGYVFLPSTAFAGDNGYANYLKSKLNRHAMVYVGSNDGMLHAFNGTTGVEVFAYVPKAVMSKLPSLASPNYTHQFYVDGTPVAGDAYINGAWKTVLVGTTGAGAKAVFGLDVTNPMSFDATKVLWEVNSAGDADLGYTIGKAQIGRTPDGNWVAIFGNGYQSDNGHAVLYVVRLDNGNITKIDTGTGSPAAPNGLSTPRLLFGADATIMAAYAGDLQGNLWKFDFSTSGTTVAFGGTPLFKAKFGLTVQPITVQAELFDHPNGGTMVLFGTGKIFETADPVNSDMQSLYGIWDNTGAAGVTTPSAISGGQSSLQAQTLTLSSSIYYQVTANVIDWNTKRGWFINLNLATGERVTIDPQLLYEQIIYTTLIPGSSVDPCITDGKSTTLQLDALTGGPLTYRVIDTDNNGVINSYDANVSGRRGELTFGTTILEVGKKAVIYQPNANGVSNTSASGVNKADSGKLDHPTIRLWRQILGKD